MTQIVETFGRRALIATSSNYTSVAEALMELVDNPFDYRRGRHLTVDVTIDRTRDLVVVADSGGEGMDDEALKDWIQWGEGHDHRPDDIGLYHVGGKSAAIYLAESMEVVCRRAGSTEIWYFNDPHWGSRTTPLTAEVESVNHMIPHLPTPARLPFSKEGFVHVILRRLKAHRYEAGILLNRLADTYRAMLEQDQCTIRVNGEAASPFQIPWTSSIPRVEIGPETLEGGLKVSGHVGAIDRDQLPTGRGIRLPHGIRTEHNGRKITDGEEFGHNLSGRGALMRLYGEITLSGGTLRPNQLKTGWPHDSDEWQVLDAYMNEVMRPVVHRLNDTAEAKPVTRQERKRANSARRRVEHALNRLRQLETLANRGSIPVNTGPGGRSSPTEKTEPTSPKPSDRTRNPVTNPTPPPRDPVGRLIRKIGGMPPVHLDGLGDHSPRTEWRQEENQRSVVVNTDYPLYQSLGGIEDYVFESLVQHVLDDDKELSPDESRRLFDQIVWLDRSEDEESSAND